MKAASVNTVVRNRGQILLSAQGGAKTLYPGGLIGMPIPEEEKRTRIRRIDRALPMRESDRRKREEKAGKPQQDKESRDRNPGHRKDRR